MAIMVGWQRRVPWGEYAESERRHDEEGDDPSSPLSNYINDTMTRGNILLAAYRGPVHVVRTGIEIRRHTLSPFRDFRVS